MQYQKQLATKFAQKVDQMTEINLLALSSNQKTRSRQSYDISLIKFKQNTQIPKFQTQTCLRKINARKLNVENLSINACQFFYHTLVNIHFEQIALKPQITNIQTHKEDTQLFTLSNKEYQHQTLKQDHETMVVKYLNCLIQSKVEFKTLQIIAFSSFKQLSILLSVIKYHEQKFLNTEVIGQNIVNPINNLESQSAIRTTKHNFKLNIKLPIFQRKMFVSFFKQLYADFKGLQNQPTESKKSKTEALKALWSQITILFHQKDQLMFTLTLHPDYGISINLKKQILKNQDLNQILQISFQSGIFITIQIQYLPQQLDTFITHLLTNLKNQKSYLVKIQNQIQITPSRITFNANNLPTNIVVRIINLLQNFNFPQFIFYGTEEYFAHIRSLFCKKRLIKFNYFMPIYQLTFQISEEIKNMELICAERSRKIMQFYLMQKQHGHKEIFLIRDLYDILNSFQFE